MIRDFFAEKKKNAELKKEQTLPVACSHCKRLIGKDVLENNQYVCPRCEHHFPIDASTRLQLLIDANTFVEKDAHMQSVNPLNFPEYEEKLKADKKQTGLNEAVITGAGFIEGYPTIIGVMDSTFRMGSMGSVVGEKITRAIELAIERKLPFILFSASGGARMQEGVLSLMQMAKTSAALEQLHQAGLLYISVMTHPTTGGVSASFASLGDINIAEPKATIGFAGRRIIEQTIRQKLPDDFQTAEFLLAHGQLDKVVHRHEMKQTLATLLKFHGGIKQHGADN